MLKKKPNENAFKGFEYMVSKDMGGLKPYQILLIDDHDENIITAKSVGWERIKFSNANAKAFDDLLVELKELGILPGNYDFVM